MDFKMTDPKTVVFFLSFVIILGFCRADEEAFLDTEHKVSRARRAAPIEDKLRIVTVVTPPYVMKTAQGQYYGYVPDLVRELSYQLNFEYEFYDAPDKRYGSEVSPGKWNGMIGEVIKRENQTKNNAGGYEGADIAAAPMTITSKREEVVNFVKPYKNLGLTVVIKKPYMNQHDPRWTWPYHFGIFRPFAGEIWGLTILCFFVVGICLWLFNRFNPYEWGGRYNLGQATQTQAQSFNLASSLWFAYSTLTWQGFERAPRSLASKLLTVFWFAFSAITLLTYSASIVNHLFWASTVHGKDFTKPIASTLEDLMLTKEYTVGTMRGGSTHNWVTKVARGAEFDVIRHLWNETGLLATDNPDYVSPLVDSMAEGLERVRNGPYAFIAESLTAKWEVNQLPCDLTTVGLFAERSYGFAVPHGWPHLDAFHMAVLRMMEEGDILALEEKWFVHNGDCWNVTEAEKVMSRASSLFLNTPKQVNLENFWGPLVMMLVGVILSFLLALAEVVYFKFRGRYSPKNQPGGAQLKLDEETIDG